MLLAAPTRTSTPSVKGSAPPMSPLSRTPLSADVQDLLRVQLLSIEPYRAVNAIMPLQMVTSFLLVATEEGLSVQEYAAKAGTIPNVMTRHLLDLGDMNRRQEPGLGLVESRPNPMNRRRNQVFLTTKGKALANAVARALATRK